MGFEARITGLTDWRALKRNDLPGLDLRVEGNIEPKSVMQDDFLEKIFSTESLLQAVDAFMAGPFLNEMMKEWKSRANMDHTPYLHPNALEEKEAGEAQTDREGALPSHEPEDSNIIEVGLHELEQSYYGGSYSDDIDEGIGGTVEDMERWGAGADWSDLMASRSRGRSLNLFNEEEDAADRFIREQESKAEAGKEAKSDTRKHMLKGFDDLFQKIILRNIEMDNDKAFVGMGPMPQILQLQLSKYMPIKKAQANSELNSLFYGVEFGTGLAENVGGNKWVRKDGRSKHESGDGSWYFAGLRQAGQKGFHFLHNAQTREPRQKWLYWIHKNFPKFLDDYFGGTIKLKTS